MQISVYIVRCVDNSLYTGVARDVDQRVWQHNNSKIGAKAIKGKRPVTLVYAEKYASLSEALKRENEIKGWRKEKKENLIRRSRMTELRKR